MTRLPVHWCASSWATMLTTAHLMMVGMMMTMMLVFKHIVMSNNVDNHPPLLNIPGQLIEEKCFPVVRALRSLLLCMKDYLLYMERPQFSMAVILPGTDTMS